MTAVADRPTITGMAAMMADPTWQPTREQVADLIKLAVGDGTDDELARRTAYEEGYWARVREENERARRLPSIFSFGQWLRSGARAAGRRENDIAAVWPWRNDYLGGPVPMWGDEG